MNHRVGSSWVTDPGLLRRLQDRPRKLGRNAKCWCGSDKKYKRCHWGLDRQAKAVERSYGPLSKLIEQMITDYLPDDADRADVTALTSFAALAYNVRHKAPDEMSDILAKAAREAVFGKGAERIQDLRETSDELFDAYVGMCRMLAEMVADARELAWDDPRTIMRVNVDWPKGSAQPNIQVVSASSTGVI